MTDRGMSMQLRIASIVAILALVVAWGILRAQNAEPASPLAGEVGGE